MRTDSQEFLCHGTKQSRNLNLSGLQGFAGSEMVRCENKVASRTANKIVILARDIVTLIIFFRRLELLYSYS